MGRSNETFNKKEKEKKRLKKQQEKKERSEVRKSNSDKGKSLEDMMAYVDENGNITTTPPDLARPKVAVKAQDIVLGTPKREEEIEEIVRTGVVTFFNVSKGFGFIRDLKSQESIFVHANGITYPIQENDRVTFEVQPGLKGLNAVKVSKVVK
jgi:cold shock CspA family protein